MEQGALLLPDDKFVIKNKGVVLILAIIEGVALIGDYIEFKCDDVTYKKKIIGIEMMRRGSLFNEIPMHFKQRIGLLIECTDEDEIVKIGKAKLNRDKAIVYKS